MQVNKVNPVKTRTIGLDKIHFVLMAHCIRREPLF